MHLFNLEWKIVGDILTFTKPETRWLSNMAFVDIEFEGVIYPSTENFYQAMKYNEQEVREYIATLRPWEAKAYSRAHPMTNDRFEWGKVRIMAYAQRKKYRQEPFQQKLLLTGDAHLEEGNWWGDRFWGVDIKTRQGENQLGEILMSIRKEMQTNIQNEVFQWLK